MNPVTLSVPEAAAAIGIGKTKLYELLNSGELRRVKLGRRTLVGVDSIDTLVGSVS